MASSAKKKVSVAKESKSKAVIKTASKSPKKAVKAVSKQAVKKVAVKAKSSVKKPVAKKKTAIAKPKTAQDVRVSRILNPTDFEKALAKKGMTMAMLSKKLKVSRQYISAIANGRSPLSEGRATEITNVLGLKVTDIFAKKENNFFRIK